MIGFSAFAFFISKKKGGQISEYLQDGEGKKALKKETQTKSYQ